MTTFEIRDAKSFDCGRMARMLRPEHQSALMRVGVNTHRELRSTFDGSYYCKAWLIDGYLAGLGGVMGSLLAPMGFAWVALTDRATRYPIAIVREVRKQLTEIMATKQELHTTVMEDDTAAQRFAVFLGFHVSDEGFGAMATSRPGRRNLHDYIASTPELRIPYKGRNLIRMGYHGEFTGSA